MSTYKRVFGSGPLGVACSLVITLATIWAHNRVPASTLALPKALRVVILAVGVFGTIGGVIWATRSLPVEKRGLGLCQRGAYRWVRHPLYAAFLTVGVPAVALFQNHWLFLAWAVALHFLWQAVVQPEERMMRREFGAAWEAYAARTGRFVPRLSWPGRT